MTTQTQAQTAAASLHFLGQVSGSRSRNALSMRADLTITRLVADWVQTARRLCATTCRPSRKQISAYGTDPRSAGPRHRLLGIAHDVIERVGDVCVWHEAAVRKCPLLRRLWGLSGHRSAIAELSSIYEYTPLTNDPTCADSGAQALRPARATVPPSLPAKSGRASTLPACSALGPPASAAQYSCRLWATPTLIRSSSFKPRPAGRGSSDSVDTAVEH